ncbi:MAG: helicase-related protein, partial [Patescibacteria group bacterium]
EQHRFGVSQRAALLSDKTAGVPHFLSMTATPIPRTLALTAFGDLDISVLAELPKGRQKIITKIISPEERSAAYSFIKNEIKKGRQAFVICPRIEISKGKNGGETTPKKLLWAEVKAVKDEHKKLAEKIFPDLKIGMLHGKLKSEEKEKAFKDFKNKKTDILTATSVVEVGIDVPNAAVIMIEDADRFGLAQLHQFRGRVGRGEHQSYCLLFSGASPAENGRLKAMENCQNGFELARKDLEIRGPGSLFGGRQWGIPDLAMASLSDVNLIKEARQEAEKILEASPNLEKYPLLREKISDFAKSVHLE